MFPDQKSNPQPFGVRDDTPTTEPHWLGPGLKSLCKRKPTNENLSTKEMTTSKNTKLALAGVAQWIECCPANQKVASLIPSQGTCLGCGSGPQWVVCERQPHVDVSLPFSKINK